MYFRLGRTRKYVEKSNEEPDSESLNDHMENCSLKSDSKQLPENTEECDDGPQRRQGSQWDLGKNS